MSARLPFERYLDLMRAFPDIEERALASLRILSRRDAGRTVEETILDIYAENAKSEAERGIAGAAYLAWNREHPDRQIRVSTLMGLLFPEDVVPDELERLFA